MIRYLIALATAAALAAAPITAQTLTLGNLKGPIARAAGKAPAKSTKELWAQLNGLPAAPIVDSLVPPAPIASNFERARFIGDGGRIPQSGKPDVVGAFRFICQPSHLAKDDPIVFLGKPGASELHEFFGNTKANAYSTFETLRTTGDSTCMNVLNRSAYWYPALLNAGGSVIRADYIAVYYKRRPASDPECTKLATKGCVALPNGLRAKADVDHFRCVTNQIHRPTIAEAIAEAIADCGGKGQVIATTMFGLCWNGKTDSADHYSHLISPPLRDRDINGAPERCGPDHPYAIPQLTQSVAWTITEQDGQVQFSMHHFHADYMTAWTSRRSIRL